MAARTELVSSSKTTLAHPFDPRLLEVVRRSTQAGVAQSSKRTYESDWLRFKSFCERHGVPALPADDATVCLFLADLRLNGIKHSTMTKALSGIKFYHEKAKLPLGRLPMVASMLSGLRREMSTQPVQRKPLLPEHLHKIAAGLRKDRLKDVRDLAIILVGWSAALRRSEIVALRREDVEFCTEGMDLTIRRRKNRQRSQFRVAVPKQASDLCPVSVLKNWLGLSGIKEGPLFRPISGDNLQEGQLEGRAVLRIVQAQVARLGLDPTEYGGHSLRAGVMTAAANAGMKIEKIVGTSDHKSIQVALGYVRNAERFENAASKGLLEDRELREKARQLATERGASAEVLCRAFLKAGVEVPLETMAEWIR
jgi:integrase